MPNDEVPTSESTPEQLPVDRFSKLAAAFQEFVSSDPEYHGQYVAEFLGVVQVVDPALPEPSYQVFYTPGLPAYQEALLAAVLDDHSLRRRQAVRWT